MSLVLLGVLMIIAGGFLLSNGLLLLLNTGSGEAREND